MAKEILKDEIMSNEELEKVAGGYNHETAQDSNFLADMGLGVEPVGSWRVSLNDRGAANQVHEAWLRMGVTVRWNEPVLGDPIGKPNQYYIGDTKVSRNEAMQYVANKLGKSVDVSKYA